MYNPSSPRHGPVPSHGASDAAAALKGASLAFSNSSRPKVIPPAKEFDGRNSALVAATTSTSRDRSRSRSPAPPQSKQTTGGSFRGHAEDQFGRDGALDSAGMRERLARLGASPPASASTPTSHLQPSSATGNRPTIYDTKSPSFIAATLAASRSASPSPQNKNPSPGRQPSMLNTRVLMAASGRRRGSIESPNIPGIEMPDTSSIAPTTSLISMFEGPHGDEANDMDPVKKSPTAPSQKPLANRRIAKPPLRPITPERSMSPESEDPAARHAEESPSPLGHDKTPKLKPKPKVKPQRAGSPDTHMNSIEKAEPAPQSSPSQVSPPYASNRLSSHANQPVNVNSRQPERFGLEVQLHAAFPPMKPAKPFPVGAMSIQPGSITIGKVEKPVMGNPQDAVASARPLPGPQSNKRHVEPLKQPQPHIVRSSIPEVVSPLPTRPRPRPKIKPPTPPQPRSSKSKSQVASRNFEPAGSVQGAMMPTKSSTDRGRSSSDARPTTSSTTSSNDTFVSASSNQTPIPPSPPPRRETAPRPASSTGIPAGTQTRSSAPLLPRRNPATVSSSSLPLHSLSNAIMAGSLAASRLTPSNTGTSSTSLGAAPPLPRRGKSPRLRQTLRQPVSLSDDESEARRIKKHHGHHTHSNKKHFHHEGARKRWREEIKPNERKRYEALWASNKGLLAEYLLPPNNSSAETAYLSPGRDATSNSDPRPELAEFVLNIVVRDIWRRCRLPDDELSEVWELVANHMGNGRKSGTNHAGMLDKQQFVVGTWIIDQRLRGRKIPAKISASVWDSAKGVRVSSPKARKDPVKVRK